jgi:hypothetical protein
MIIGVDFDGTVVAHEFPKIWKSIGAERVLRRLVDAGHRLVLFTMRSDQPEVSSDDPTIHAEPGNYPPEPQYRPRVKGFAGMCGWGDKKDLTQIPEECPNIATGECGMVFVGGED